MLAILSGVVGLSFLLWMFHDFIWKTPPSAERQLGKPDQPIEYNLVQSSVSHVVYSMLGWSPGHTAPFPYLNPKSAFFPTLILIWPKILYPFEDLTMNTLYVSDLPNDEKVALSKNIPNSRQECKSPFPRKIQVCLKLRGFSCFKKGWGRESKVNKL